MTECVLHHGRVRRSENGNWAYVCSCGWRSREYPNEDDPWYDFLAHADATELFYQKGVYSVSWTINVVGKGEAFKDEVLKQCDSAVQSCRENPEEAASIAGVRATIMALADRWDQGWSVNAAGSTWRGEGSFPGHAYVTLELRTIKVVA